MASIGNATGLQTRKSASVYWHILGNGIDLREYQNKVFALDIIINMPIVYCHYTNLDISVTYIKYK